MTQIKKRLSRSVERSSIRHKRDLDLYMKYVVKKPLKEWDLEELAHGKPRNRNGGFSHGPRLSLIDDQVAAEIKRRTRSKGLDEMRRHLPQAIQVMADLMTDEDPRIRFLAAKFIIEYGVGDPPSENERGSSSVLQGLLASALVLPSGLKAHPTIMGEVVEEKEEVKE